MGGRGRNRIFTIYCFKLIATAWFVMPGGWVQELDSASEVGSELVSAVGTPFLLSPAEELAFNSIIKQMIGEGEEW